MSSLNNVQMECMDLSENIDSSKSNLLSFDDVVSIIQLDDSEKLQEIIEAQQISDINVRSSGYPAQTFLNFACLIGSVECAAVLLNNDANINEDTYHASNLKYACQSGNHEMIKFVIHSDFTIND